MNMENRSNQEIAMKVSWISIVMNVVLSGFKLIAGILGHSAALVSDAVHSMSDVFSTMIVMIGVRKAGKDADERHPYGHERFESVAAILLSVILGLVGLGIGYSGIQTVLLGEYHGLRVPTLLPLIAAILSIVIKEAMYRYTAAAAKKINSGALMADAWHHRSDSLSSIGGLIGVLGARMGFPLMDPLASLVISVFIVKAAISIFLDAIGKMIDQSADEETVEEMRRLILAQEEVLGIDRLRTRIFGDKMYVDVDISVDGEKTLTASHKIAHRVHDEIEGHFENVKHCMVHVNPGDQRKPMK